MPIIILVYGLKRNNMKQYENFEDDNLAQIGDSIYVHSGHLDTTINEMHIITDTFISHDTVYVETQTFAKEIEIIEKLIDRPGLGGSAVSILILLFAIYSVWKKWNCKKEN